MCREGNSQPGHWMARAIVCPGNLAVLTFTTHRQTADAQRLVPEGYQSLRLSVDKKINNPIIGDQPSMCSFPSPTVGNDWIVFPSSCRLLSRLRLAVCYKLLYERSEPAVSGRDNLHIFVSRPLLTAGIFFAFS